MRYRADIDGLRALAVGGVLASHVQVNPFLVGGFLGVDIFFVISGYLISSIMFAEYDTKGAFSFSQFYLRRSKRILPALVIVAICTVLTGYHMLPASNFLELQKSVLSALGSFANIYFYFTTEYWQKHAMVYPFIHTWSLGVEEQFYLLFPFLIIFFLIKKRYAYIKFFGILSLVGLASYIVCTQLNSIDRVFTFYMLPTRLWEMLAGVLLATYERAFPQRLPRAMAQPLSVLALGLILVAMLFVENFSGHLAIVVVLASVVLLACPHSIVANIFSTSPCVFLGKISYSLYLWHWPVWTFWSYTKAEISLWDSLGIAIVSIMLATLSLHICENPYRKLATWKAFLQKFIPLILVFFLLLILTYTFSRPTVRQGRVQPAPISFLQSEIADVEGGKAQILGKKGVLEDAKQTSFIVMGDSHAQLMGSVFDELAQKYHQKGALLIAQGMPIILPSEEPITQSAFSFIQKLEHVDTIVIIQRWSRDVKKKERIIEAIRTLLHMGKVVYLVEQAPIHAKQTIFMANYSSDQTQTASVQGAAFVQDIVEALAHKNVHVIPTTKFFKEDDGTYAFMQGDNLLYQDDHHLSYLGTRRLLSALEDFFSKISIESKAP